MKEALKLYTTLTTNKLEETILKSLTADVKASVTRAQACADRLINEVTAKDGPNETLVTSNLRELLVNVPAVVRDHWRGFAEEVMKLLPAELQADVVAVEAEEEPGVDHALEGARAQLEEQDKRISDLSNDNARLRQLLADKEKVIDEASDAVKKYRDSEASAVEAVKLERQQREVLQAKVASLQKEVQASGLPAAPSQKKSAGRR